MRIAIVGLGGVGGYLGAKLARLKEKHEVVFIARGEHLGAIKEKGLTLRSQTGSETVRPTAATDDASSLGCFDLVLFCTKSYDLQRAAQTLRTNIGPNTYLLALANGVAHNKKLEVIYPNAKVLNGCIYILAHLSKPGVVCLDGKGALLVFGSDNLAKSELEALDLLFKEAGIKTKIADDILSETWKKYLFIAAFATLTSYHEESMGAVLKFHRYELDQVMDEILAVALAMGAKLDHGDVEHAIELARKSPYEATTSMQLDFQKGRKTELETLAGYIVHKADALGINAPVMNVLYHALVKKASSLSVR